MSPKPASKSAKGSSKGAAKAPSNGAFKAASKRPFHGRATAPAKAARRPSSPGGESGAFVRVRPVRVGPVASVAQVTQAISDAVAGLRYELVDIERAARGLLRVTIDRVPGQAYGDAGDSVTVDDCERVTRQLQTALEVEGADYARLEVSSPGLDRPLKTEADYRRFTGHEVTLTLKLPFEGRRNWRGVLQAGAEGFSLHMVDGRSEQQLGFALAEVREARLVPVLDFKGRKTAGAAPQSATAAE